MFEDFVVTGVEVLDDARMVEDELDDRLVVDDGTAEARDDAVVVQGGEEVGRMTVRLRLHRPFQSGDVRHGGHDGLPALVDAVPAREEVGDRLLAVQELLIESLDEALNGRENRFRVLAFRLFNVD